MIASAWRQNNSLADPGFLDTFKTSIVELWKAVRQRSVFLPTLFIFLWQATPHSESAMFYFTYVYLCLQLALYLLFCDMVCGQFKIPIANNHLCSIFLINLDMFYSTNKLGFTPEFLGRVKLVTSVASLLGVGLYNGFLKNVPLRKIFLITTVFGTALGLTQVFFL